MLARPAHNETFCFHGNLPSRTTMHAVLQPPICCQSHGFSQRCELKPVGSTTEPIAERGRNLEDGCRIPPLHPLKMLQGHLTDFFILIDVVGLFVGQITCPDLFIHGPCPDHRTLQSVVYPPPEFQDYRWPSHVLIMVVPPARAARVPW